MIYNRLDKTPEEKVFALCREQNLGVLARVPLASGFLSGKYRPGSSFGKNDVRGGQEKAVIDQRLREVEEISARRCRRGRIWRSGRWRGVCRTRR